MPQITVNNLTVKYANGAKKVVALNDLSVTLLPNAFNVVIGYSGCGKTTLLRAIAGQLDYDGEILFDGENVKNVSVQKRKMAYVPQQPVLYSDKTIFDNIAFPLKLMGASRTDIISRVRALAHQLDITVCLTRKPKHLSGGQQQRVALARALIKNPSVCLMDEPFANVDPSQRVRSRMLVKQTLAACGCTAVYVTHDLSEAMAMADNLVVIDQGRVVVAGLPLSVFNSGNAVVESLKNSTFSLDENE